jgi:hypothetical protein
MCALRDRLVERAFRQDFDVDAVACFEVILGPVRMDVRRVEPAEFQGTFVLGIDTRMMADQGTKVSRKHARSRHSDEVGLAAKTYAEPFHPVRR